MIKAIEFLKECNVFYVATAQEDQPRVRPFGAVCVYEGKAYICTNNTKEVFKQLTANPKLEICALSADGRWLRLEARAIADGDAGARSHMLDTNPSLKMMYSLDDGIFEVLRLDDAKATVYSFTAQPEVAEI